MSKPRVGFTHIAKGIAIILVIIGHTVYGLMRDIIFSFHIPLFVIASGYLFKEKSFKEKIKTYSLIIYAYYYCSICYYIF